MSWSGDSSRMNTSIHVGTGEDRSVSSSKMARVRPDKKADAKQETQDFLKEQIASASRMKVNGYKWMNRESVSTFCSTFGLFF